MKARLKSQLLGGLLGKVDGVAACFIGAENIGFVLVAKTRFDLV